VTTARHGRGRIRAQRPDILAGHVRSSSTSSTTPRPRRTAASSTTSPHRAARPHRHPGCSDGVDVRDCFGGCTAAELRLWEALEADLLCPFHHFGVSDETDLSQLDWRKGDYDTSALTRVYTADDARVRIVLRELQDKVDDVRRMRALRFCVSVDHAEYMAAAFNARGVPALAVSGTTPRHERAAALAALRDREVNVLFAVDLFKEGLDVPDVDALLLLRPTQSATVFLRQLGRGLRRTPDKPVLTVLDFIGHQRTEYRFDLKYRSLTGDTRQRLARQIERGFAFLPSGCELVLDRVAQQVVLDNVMQQLKLNRKELASELRIIGDVDLATYLAESGHELTNVLKYGSWTAMRRAAGLPTPAAADGEEAILRRVAALAHVDDSERADTYTALLATPVRYDELSDRNQRFARMLFFALWPNGGGHATYQAGFQLLAQHDAVREELGQLIAYGMANVEHVTRPLEPGLESVTLRTDARYSSAEVLAALGYATLERPPANFREGVLWTESLQTDAFFVTISKSERDYAPTTMYHDYAISPSLFHWESQNATSVDSPVGRRYLAQRESGTHVLLFAREAAYYDWDKSRTRPYTPRPGDLQGAHGQQADRHHVRALPPDADRQLPSGIAYCLGRPYPQHARDHPC
jgi:hypothetical protein